MSSLNLKTSRLYFADHQCERYPCISCRDLEVLDPGPQTKYFAIPFRDVRHEYHVENQALEELLSGQTLVVKGRMKTILKVSSHIRKIYFNMVVTSL
jgi:hypothetical protein